MCLLIAGLALISASTLAGTWTGADNLPTEPLSCDATPARATARAYDGGVTVREPNRRGKTLNVVDVPKLIGIGYFNATSKGIAAAAKELGTVKVRTDGPT